jgi:hypothetical protein
MNGAHDTALDRSIVIKSLSHRSKAVGGAGSSGDDLVLGGKGVLVYGEYDSLKILACGSRDNNLLSAGINVSLALVLRAVETGALKNNVYADLAPRKLGSVSLSIDLKGLAVYGNGVSLIVSLYGVKILTYLAAVTALSGIILEKVGEHGRLGKVVDSNDLITLSAKHLSERKTTDTAKTINSNFN